MKILKANVCTILIVGLFAHPWVISRVFERDKNLLENKDTQKLIYLENDDDRYSASEETLKLLKKHKNKLTKLAELLLEKEVIFKEDLLDIFGPRPWDKKIEEKDESKEKKDEPKQVDNASNDK